ncbi:MAG: hypothetical protein LBS59_01220 [Puniceicoccales bacterium]|jgi:hypothetical protein|nr:hypothetical protein [Puniceicoccales bacterium]
MKRIYIILPVALIAAFATFYYQDRQRADAHARQQTARREAAAKAEQAKKDADAAKARADAAKRSAEREAAERTKEAEKLAKWQKAQDELAAETARLNATVKTLQTEVDGLEKTLATRKLAKSAAQEKLFATQKANEHQTLARQSKELEIQRVIDIIRRRVEASEALLPPPPAPVAAKPVAY